MTTLTTRAAGHRARRAGASAPARRRRYGLHSNAIAIVLVAPAVILLLLFTVAPGVYAFVLSLHENHVTGGLFGGQTVEVFVGFKNYAASLGDGEFWASIGRMLMVAVIGVPATVILATVFALCLDARGARLTGLSRIVIFLPYAVPGVIASMLWGFLYLPATSPIGGDVIDYFGSRNVAFTVANIAVWGVVGFNMIVIYTALRAIPGSLYDAAAIDGASELKIALRVKLPMIRPALAMVTLFSALGALQLYNEPTALRPLANVITSSWVPLMKVYSQAFVENDIYQGAASAIIIVVLTVGATVLVNVIGSSIGPGRERSR